MNKSILFSLLALSSLGFAAVSNAQSAGGAVAPIYAQAKTDGEANKGEFTLTAFSDTVRGWSFMRPSSWTQDQGYKEGIRFVGGDEWLTLQVIPSKESPQAYASALKLPAGETKLGIKPFNQGKFSAQVLSSKSQGKSSVTAKPIELLTDRWVFSPAPGKLVVLSVTGPSKVFDWEGNRDMALSLKLK